ncbi:hypothetical protein B2J93_7988 [Marssonina coronariae]|uniref:Uncharacterized protein n=1 Tax=Diplocarpon coronariae TaxID=2795749 RepID=A0A218ZDL2_9HELO|nr:hypothetical protein B2J93_7988 [Marssonina coronariae]
MRGLGMFSIASMRLSSRLDEEPASPRSMVVCVRDPRAGTHRPGHLLVDAGAQLRPFSNYWQVIPATATWLPGRERAVPQKEVQRRNLVRRAWELKPHGELWVGCQAPAGSVPRRLFKRAAVARCQQRRFTTPHHPSPPSPPPLSSPDLRAHRPGFAPELREQPDAAVRAAVARPVPARREPGHEHVRRGASPSANLLPAEGAEHRPADTVGPSTSGSRAQTCLSGRKPRPAAPRRCPPAPAKDPSRIRDDLHSHDPGSAACAGSRTRIDRASAAGRRTMPFDSHEQPAIPSTCLGARVQVGP